MPDCEDRFLLVEGHPKFQLQERVNLEEQKAQFDDRFLRGRQVALHDL